MIRRLLAIFLVCLPVCLHAVNKSDSTHYADGTRIYPLDALYQGTIVKLDLGSLALNAGLSRGKIISPELAVSCRLKNRYYPTIETGYTIANDLVTAGSTHTGHGGFVRLGADFNGLKRHPESQNALLIGLRLATSMQSYSLTDVTWNSPLDPTRHDYSRRFRADCWGEALVGCQVQIYGGLNMGWAVRVKLLFTRKAKTNNVLPYYLPGYGYRSETNWGVNYYIGYKF